MTHEETYPNLVYYNDNHNESWECTRSLSKVLKITYTLPNTWQMLIAELETGAKFLAVHVDMLERSVHSTPIEFVEAITTVLKFMPESHDLKIAVIIKPTTPLSLVRTLQKSGIQGILLDLNYNTVEETAVGINAMINHIPYWPKDILDKLPCNAKILANVDNVTLTTRQEQVFRLVTERGSSNKVIGKNLGISESTVKLHLTEIFKKYGVHNRTQLAVLSHVPFDA